MIAIDSIFCKDIIPAGDFGLRLSPLALLAHGQQLRTCDKPMINRSFISLIMADLQDILVISTLDVKPRFEQLLGEGSQWGINFSYCAQSSLDNLPKVFVLGERFVGNGLSAPILADRLYCNEHDLVSILKCTKKQTFGFLEFPHCFLTHSETTKFMYKKIDYCSPEHGPAIIWRDEKLKIEWLLNGLVPWLSDKDTLGDHFGK